MGDLGDMLNANAGRTSIVYMLGASVVPGAFMGTLENGVEGITDVVELAAVGQLMSPEGSPIVDENDQGIQTVVRLAIPKSMVPYVLESIHDAYHEGI